MVAESEILQVEGYYPFGLGHEGLGDVQVGVENAYGYNGKELNDDFGLGWNDYGARWYMADIGRWGTVDPLAEKYVGWSEYNYVLGNPLKFIDPDGKQVDIIYTDGEEEKNYTYVYEKGRDYDKIESKFLKETIRALDFLFLNEGMNVKIGEEVDDSKVDVLKKLIEGENNIISIKEGDENKFKPSTNSITFNSNQGIIFRIGEGAKLYESHLTSEKIPDNLGRNSPASLLGHELFHAYNKIYDSESYNTRKATGKVDGFPNEEERYVTTNLANQMNKTLGESERMSYNRNYYTVSSSVSVIPPKPPKQ